MDPVWQWGIDVIRWIQLFHGPVLDLFFKAITFMGNEDFYMILLPLVFWCVDVTVGIRLAFIFLISSYTNNLLKGLFAHPRPFHLDPSVQLLEIEGYGLPSGHSQSSVVVWGTVAAELHRTWAWAIALSLAVLIGFSRIYLGVHFPTDVLAGWIVGAIFLAAYFALRHPVERWLKDASLEKQVVLALCCPLVLLLYPTAITTSITGVLMGFGTGAALLCRLLPFRVTDPFWKRFVRFVVGMVILLAIRFGLAALFPGEEEPFYLVFRVFRYMVIGFWVGFGGPWLFLKLRVASREDSKA
jgi:membrane-associated phospholipid phosphatase